MQTNPTKPITHLCFARRADFFRAAAAVVSLLVILTACNLGWSQTAQAGKAAIMRTERALEKAKQDSTVLRGFLLQMPKGADLHMHLGGAIYAETFLREAIASGSLCVDPKALALVPMVSSMTSAAAPACPEGDFSVRILLRDQAMYDALVDSFSMRSFVPSAGISGHDHFFAAFDKFGAVGKTDKSTIDGEWLDEVATRAAAQNEQYLEVMETLDYGRGGALGEKVGWNSDFNQMRQSLLDAGLRQGVLEASQALNAAEAHRRKLEHCSAADASPGCRVEIRYLFQSLRGLPPEQVFARTLLGFEIASVDPRVVGINFVMPEDGLISMRDYELHMKMFSYFHGIYPKVHISLHAGELAFGLVPPEGLKNHIRLAVEEGHAGRIGHGVDIGYEDQASDLVREMAAKHVMVEINLTSNDLILNVKGKQHPLALYRAAHVPVALSTDDEGVSRTDITREWERGVEEQGLDYGDLKQVARTSLEHAFLPGEDLWEKQDSFDVVFRPCGGNIPGGEHMSTACAAFLKSSEKATQQWELERRFRLFEAAF